MGVLVMALRCQDGVVVASDTTHQLSHDRNPCVLPIGERVCALLEPDVGLATSLTRSFLSKNQSYSSIMDLAQQCGQFCAASTKGKKIPPTGVIFAGIDPGDVGRVQFYGISSTRQFAARSFADSVFGGINSVARYLDSKMNWSCKTVSDAEQLAAFFICQTAATIGGDVLGDHVGMATITYAEGFKWVEESEVLRVLNGVRDWAVDLLSDCTCLFLEDQPASSTIRGKK